MPDVKIANALDTQKYIDYIEAKEQLDKHALRWYLCSNGYKFDLLLALKTLHSYQSKQQVKDADYQKALVQRSQLQEEVQKVQDKRDAAYGAANIQENSKTREQKFDETEGLGDKVYVKRAEILELFGRFYKVMEVASLLKNEWGIEAKEVSTDGLTYFYRKNIEKIEELKKHYEESINDLRLGKRVARLDELTWIYHEVKGKFLKYESREDAKLMMQLLEQIKKEVDGDLVINGKLKIDIEHTINIQIQNQMLKELNITALIVTKLSGRLNINPQFIISRLAHSYYAKFSGFTGASRSEMLDDDIYYASGIAYNWHDIITKSEVIRIEEIKMQELPQYEEAIIIETKSIKEKMIEEIQRKQQALQEAEKNMKKNEK